ncbi:unnamed protein product [Pleuronectes platessa]|uniref:Uncharacterized protein n=1 Tax=Pleuronectes platessa TaxID=8262 RepID=A0A9N7U0R4_PLEPL|nr:unnamed protein product [Pleuronectes platessa]
MALARRQRLPITGWTSGYISGATLTQQAPRTKNAALGIIQWQQTSAAGMKLLQVMEVEAAAIRDLQTAWTESHFFFNLSVDNEPISCSSAAVPLQNQLRESELADGNSFLLSHCYSST